MTEFFNFSLQTLEPVLVAGSRKDLMDELRHLAHFRLLHTPGSQGGGAQTNAAGDLGRSLVKGDAVFVYGDAGCVQSFLGILAGEAGFRKVHEEEMIIRPTRDQLVTQAEKFGGQGTGIKEDLLLVPY